MSQLNTPVAFIVFNRPEATRRVFAAIAAARPSRLFIIADAARPEREGEQQRSDEVKRIITAVDWPCTVETNFATENLGCRRRVKSGLDWVFSRVEKSIILEDDCLTDQSFFPYCAEMLERYQDYGQIGLISGFNPLQSSFPFSYSYYFTKMVQIWGWATWRRSWQKYDDTMVSWPRVKQDALLKQMWKDRKPFESWTSIFDSMYSGEGPDAWSYNLIYSSWTNNWLNIIPKRNLIQNIGFDKYATHTTKADRGFKIGARNLELPIVHPPAIIEWAEYAEAFQHRFYTPSFVGRAWRKLGFMLKPASLD